VAGWTPNVRATSETDFPSLIRTLGELLLFLIHFLGTAEAHSALFGVGTSSASTRPDQVAFKFGDAGEDGHDHLSGVGRGVGPRLGGDGLKTGPGVADGLHYFQQIGVKPTLAPPAAK
jgi:hypothetical protein